MIIFYTVIIQICAVYKTVNAMQRLLYGQYYCFSMKYIVLYVVALAVVTNAQFPSGGINNELINKVKVSVTECVLKTGVNLADINKILGNSVPTGNEACFLACVLKKLHIMGSNNKIEMEPLKKLLETVKSKENYNKIMEVLQTCSDKQGSPNSDECIAAANYKQCLVENGH